MAPGSRLIPRALVTIAISLAIGPPCHGVERLSPTPIEVPPADLPSVQYNPFEDIPPGHPAYEAIEELIRSGILDGFPDGTFKGRRIITRYDLALALAKAKARIESLEAQGPPVSPEERQLIDKLSREVGTELSLLGIRTDSLEQRILRVENTEDTLRRQKTNINLLGFYRIEQSMVMEPFRFGSNPDFPFVQETFPFLNFRDRGVIPLKQEGFLRLTGHPNLDGVLENDIEAFAELRTILVGNGGLHLNHDFSDPGVAGDRIDDLATGVEDEARIFFNRAHFTMKAKNMFLRIFSNESASDLSDPDVLFTVDSFEPFSGGEVNGGIGKLTYSSSVMKRQLTEGFTGLDVRDIRRFTPTRTLEQDLYTLRLTYEPWKRSKKVTNKTLRIGSSFVELADDYHTINGFNRVIGVDAQFAREGSDGSHWDLTSSYLMSVGFGDLWDRAIKMDGSYQKEGLLGNVKFYRFGPNFRSEVAQNQFVDTGVSFNFHRHVTRGLLEPLSKGENLLRLQIRNDWLGDIEMFDNLILSAVYEVKSWSRDPNNPLYNDDEQGSRFYFQSIFDMTPRWRIEFFSEYQKDIRTEVYDIKVLKPQEKEIGTFSNVFKTTWRLQDNLTLSGEVETKDDFDAYDFLGDRFNQTRHKEVIEWQAHPRIFLKGANEVVFNSDIQLNGLPFFPVNQRNFFRRILEFNVIPIKKVSIKGLIVNQISKNNLLRSPAGGPTPSEPDPPDFRSLEDNNTVISVLETFVNFTPALKLRYVFAVQDTNLINSNNFPLYLNDILLKNHFVDLTYNPTVSTEIQLTFGTEWENPNDPLDNGPAKFFSTAKIIQLRAQTNF